MNFCTWKFTLSLIIARSSSVVLFSVGAVLGWNSQGANCTKGVLASEEIGFSGILEMRAFVMADGIFSSRSAWMFYLDSFLRFAASRSLSSLLLFRSLKISASSREFLRDRFFVFSSMLFSLVDNEVSSAALSRFTIESVTLLVPCADSSLTILASFLMSRFLVGSIGSGSVLCSSGLNYRRACKAGVLSTLGLTASCKILSDEYGVL